jgi:cytidylate kinase
MAVITISRQSGSEGNKVTEILCERLGYRYFDKNLMAQLATEIGEVPNQYVDVSMDEHQPKGFFERAFGNFQTPFGDPGGWTLAAQNDARKALSVQQIRGLILAAYKNGNIIVVGRGGMVVLAGMPDVLHVRLVAPQETRIQRWQAREGLTYDAARKRVNDRDAAHIDFVRRFFNVDVADPALYDLVISTEKFAPEAAADLIIRALEALKESGSS